MSPRTSTSRLLLALAGMAAFGAVVAWWSVPEGGAHAVVEPLRETRPKSTEPATAVLANVATVDARTSSLPVIPAESPCLEDGYTSITGVVVDADGAPIAGARVAVLGALHAADALGVRGEAISDEFGRFDVRTPTPGDVLVAAVAPGMRPATRGLAIEEGFVDLAQPLQLERGLAISGRVLAGDDPLERVELEAAGPRSSRRVQIGEYELALIDGRLEWGASRCTTGEDGRWAFQGLAPGRWVVRPRAFRCPGAVFPPGALAAEAIDAPARDVDLRIPAARLAVDVVADGEPLAWAEVEVEYRGLRSSRRADAHGRLEVDVSPDEGIAVVVRAPGRSPSREVVTGPRRGERRELTVSAGPLAPSPQESTFRALR
jgi:hypothetical protein